VITITREEGSLVDMQPGNYLDSQINGMIENIGRNWRRDGEDRRDYGP